MSKDENYFNELKNIVAVGMDYFLENKGS